MNIVYKEEPIGRYQAIVNQLRREYPGRHFRVKMEGMYYWHHGVGVEECVSGWFDRVLFGGTWRELVV